MASRRFSACVLALTWVVLVCGNGAISAWAGTYDQVIVADGPRGYWRLGETSGTTAADSSGNGLAGTYVGAPTLGTTGIPGIGTDTAVQFNNGGNKYMSAADTVQLTSPVYTLEAWIKPDVVPATGIVNLLLRNRNNGEDSQDLRINNGKFEHYTWDGSGRFVTDTTTAITAGNWYHVVGVYQGGASGFISLYVNGQRVANWNGNLGTPWNQGTKWNIAESATSTAGVQAVVDEVAVYNNKALDANTIEYHYAMGTSTAAWNRTGGGDWDDVGAWADSPFQGSDAKVVFGREIAADSIVNLNNPVTAGAVYFHSPAKKYVLTGSNSLTFDVGSGDALLRVISGAPLVMANVALNDRTQVSVNSGAELMVSGQISGASGLTKAGGGPLFLTTSNSAYSGPTTINAGTLSFANGALGSGTLTFGASGTLQWYGSNTQDISAKIQPLASGVVATLDTNGNPVTLAGPLSGQGGLAKVGNGTLKLTGNNTYSGPTNINTGAVEVASLDPAAGNLGSGPINFAGGTLRFAAGLAPQTINRRITLNTGGGVLDTNGNTVTLEAAVAGAAGLTKAGAGTLVVSNVQGYTGSTVINAGTLQLGSTPASLPSVPAVWLDAGDVTGTGAENNPASGTTLGVWVNKGTTNWMSDAVQGVTANQPTFASYGMGSLPVVRFDGVGDILTGSYLNSTDHISVIAVMRRNGTTQGNAGPMSFTTTGQMDHNNLQSFTLWNGGGGGPSFRLHRNNATVADSSPHPANGAAFVGDVVFDGANAYTYVNGIQGATSAASTGNFNIQRFSVGGRLGAAGGAESDWWTGEVAEFLVYDTALSAADRQAIENYLAGKWFGVLPTASPVLISSGATLDLNGANQTIVSLSDGTGGGGTVTNTNASLATLSITGTSTIFSGSITDDGTHKVALVKSGGGVQYLAGNNTYTGDTIVAGGYLVAFGDNALGAASAPAVVYPGGTLQLERWLDHNTAVTITGKSVTLNGLGVGGTRGALASWAGTTAWDGPVILASDSSIYVNQDTLTVSGDISETADAPKSLTKTGGGTLVLSGNNTYSGASNLNGGTTVVSGMNSLGIGTDVNFNNGSVLKYADGATAETITRNITLNAPGGTISVNEENTVTMATAMTGTGSFTKAGPGTMVFDVPQAYTGPTTVNAGTLQGNVSTLPASITNGGTVVFDQAESATFAGAVTGTGGVTKQKAGTLTISGLNSYTGPTVISGGTLKLEPLPTVAPAGSSLWLDASDAATLFADEAGVFPVTFSGDPVAMWQDKSGNGLNVVQSDPTKQPTYQSETQLGRSTVRFDAANDGMTTPLAVSGGDLAVFAVYNFRGTDTNLGHRAVQGSTNWLMGPYTGQHRMYAGNWVGNSLGVTQNAFVLQTAVQNAALATNFVNGTAYGTLANPAFPGTIGLGTAGLAGTETLNGDLAELLVFTTALSAADRTAIEAYLAAKWLGATPLPSATDVSIAADSALDLNGMSQTIGSLADFDGAGGEVLNSGGDLTLTLGGSANTSFSGTIGDGGGTVSLVKHGSGEQALLGANTYSGGTAINGGALAVNSVDPDTGNLGPGPIVFDGGLLKYAEGAPAETISRELLLETGGGGVDTNGNTVTISSALTGPGGLTKAGDGTLALTSMNFYSGPTTINGGKLEIAAVATNLGGGPIRFGGGLLKYADGAADEEITHPITLNAGGGGIETAGNTVIIANPIDGPGGLTKAGNGTLILALGNTYTGGTTVSGGTLRGDTTTLRGVITNDATVHFDQVNDGTFLGAISGTGTLLKTGGGVLTLPKAPISAYNGPTQINEGTLRIGAVAAPDGAQVHFSFDEPADLGRNDLGTGYDGVLVDAAASSGVSGGAVDFSGSGYLRSSLSPSEVAYGVSLWVRSDATGDQGMFNVCGPGALGGENDRNIYVQGGQTKARLWLDSHVDELTANVNVADGQWHHVVHTFGTEIGGQKLYIDGALQASGPGTFSAYNDVTDPRFIGHDQGITAARMIFSSLPGFVGSMDELRVYAQALTADDVVALALNGYAGVGGNLSDVIGDLSPVTLSGTSRFDLNGYRETIGSLAGEDATAEVVLGTGTLTIGGNDADTTFAGVISGEGGKLVKIGAGNLELAGVSTYDGGTTVEGGTLTIANSAALPAGTGLTIGAGGTVVLGGGASASGASHATAAAVPEPSTLGLLGVALVGLVFAMWRRR